MDERSIIRWQRRLKREHPTCTERKSLLEECGWKGGDSGDSAGEKPCLIRKQKNPLDSDRPSHGRRLHSSYERGCQEKKILPAPQEDAGVVTCIQPHLILRLILIHRGVVALAALARRRF